MSQSSKRQGNKVQFRTVYCVKVLVLDEMTKGLVGTAWAKWGRHGYWIDTMYDFLGHELEPGIYTLQYTDESRFEFPAVNIQ